MLAHLKFCIYHTIIFFAPTTKRIHLMSSPSSLFFFQAQGATADSSTPHVPNRTSSSSSSSSLPAATESSPSPTNASTATPRQGNEIASLLLRLVQHQFRTHGIDSDNNGNNQAQVAKIFRLCVRLLNSRISLSTAQQAANPSASQMLLAESIKKRCTSKKI